MRSGRIAPAVIGTWLDDLSRRDMWIGLSTADPFTVDDPITTEIPGAAYRRARVVWQRASVLLLRNGNVLQWTGLLPGTQVACLVGWSAAFNGDPLVTMPLPELRHFPAGGAIKLGAGEVYVGADV